MKNFVKIRVTIAYIVCPDICLDCLSEFENEKTTYSRLFLSQLMDEKWRVSSQETKRYFGFLPPYHFDKFIEIIVGMISPYNEKKLTDEEINLIQLVLKSVERDGIESYPYVERYTPILDLAEDKSSIYDVFIVCNNEAFCRKLREIMNNPNYHFKKYIIYSAKEALFNLPKN